MQQLSSAQAEEALTHLTHHFAQWRQSRRTPRGRIPQELWAQAVALTATLPVTRVAHQLGLTPHALKKRREALNSLAAPLLPPQARTCRSRGSLAAARAEGKSSPDGSRSHHAGSRPLRWFLLRPFEFR
jgi:hypothetical protein